MLDIDTVLIKPVSRCNINCHYCYVYNMGDTSWGDLPKQMSSATMLAVARSLGDLAQTQHRRFAVVLHGGEPLLLGGVTLNFFLTALRRVLCDEYPMSLQTNGTLITEDILDICAHHHISIGVSLDGPRHVHDRHRVGHQGEGTYQHVVAGITRLRQHRAAPTLYAGLLVVIDPTSDPQEVYDSCKTLGAPSVDFLYRDGHHSHLPYGKASVHSTEYGRWLATLFDIYLADPTPIPIRVLDDMIKLWLGGVGTKEGMGTAEFGIVVIETDGSIRKNDTLKSAFRGADRFTHPWSVHTHALTDVARTPEFAAYYALQRPTASVCRACPELALCGGGMPVHRWHNDNGYDNPSVYCADQLCFIGHMRTRLATLLPAGAI